MTTAGRRLCVLHSFLVTTWTYASLWQAGWGHRAIYINLQHELSSKDKLLLLYRLHQCFTTLPTGWLQSTAIFICVCLSVHLHISKTTRTKPHVQLHTIFCMLPVTMAPTFADNDAICYVIPVLWTTSCFNIMPQIQIQATGELFSMTDSPGGAGGKVSSRQLPCSDFLEIHISIS